MNQLSRRGLHWLLSRFGTRSAKSASFDQMFTSGKWAFNGDIMLADIVDRHSQGGSILMLGCGTGTLAREARRYSYFLGVDLSSVAIGEARRHTLPNAHFHVGDMTRFETNRRFDVIVFSESIYYVPWWKRKALLKRLRSNLTPHGVFIVTIAQPKRYDGILKMIRVNFVSSVDARFHNSSRHLIVFQ